MTATPTDAELAARIRTTLRSVADVVPDERVAWPVQPEAKPRVVRPLRRRPAVVAAGGGLAALALVAFAAVQTGSEYVQELPPADFLAEGTAEGVRFWLVPSFHRDVCGQPMQGVELVSGATNKVGREWNTGGLAYGDQTDARPGCPRFDQARWLGDPSRIAVSWTRLGVDDDGPWGATLAVHPSAASVVVAGPGLAPVTAAAVPREDAPAGPRYAAVGVPEDARAVTVTVLDAEGRELATETRDLSRLGT
jgi:hypothetical protein